MVNAKLYTHFIDKETIPQDFDKEKISKKIMAAEIIKIYRKNSLLFIAGAIIPFTIYGLNFIFPTLTPIVAVGSAGLFGWSYMKTNQEQERLVKKYGL